MSFVRNTILTRILEETQSEEKPKFVCVLGLVIAAVLSVLSIVALAAITIDASASTLERVWYIILIALILWYDVGFCKKFLRRTKRNEQ